MRLNATRLLLCTLLLLAGCRSLPVRGVVIKKDYRPAWEQLYFQQIYIGNNQYMQMPAYIHHPEQWDIVVQSDGTTGDEGQFLVVVSHSYYDRVSLGDIWERADTVHQEQRQ